MLYLCFFLSGVSGLILALEGDESTGWKPGAPTPFLNSRFYEQDPMFSPDGRWLAFVSNKSGRAEVYVRRYPGPPAEWLVSTDGGRFATWSRTRDELVYTTLQGAIMKVAYTVEGDSMRPGKPQPWLTGRLTGSALAMRRFDLHPDGQRLLLASSPPPDGTTEQNKVVFVFNFFDELRRLAPAR